MRLHAPSHSETEATTKCYNIPQTARFLGKGIHSYNDGNNTKKNYIPINDKSVLHLNNSINNPLESMYWRPGLKWSRQTMLSTAHTPSSQYRSMKEAHKKHVTGADKNTTENIKIYIT
jgi:hypothetical protein